MHLHEYQAKQLFVEYGIPVPDGQIVHELSAVDAAVNAIGGDTWVVKAQEEFARVDGTTPTVETAASDENEPAGVDSTLDIAQTAAPIAAKEIR